MPVEARPFHAYGRLLTMSQVERTIEGHLKGVTGKIDVSDIEVWFIYRTVEGKESTTSVRTGDGGEFTLLLPDERLDSARVGANVEGVGPVDLEPGGERLEPGDLTLVVDDIVPSHLRYGSA